MNFDRVLDIKVQKLFLLTLILKVGASFLGWRLQDPWILGFTVPLLMMCAYIAIGLFRRDKEVTDEKFADSCYYLGFIFTITSIIFCLFDLPNIGARIQDIAVRFGAAMVSTVFGLGVRVYLVSFKRDAADALGDAEDAVLDSARRFTEQLTMALERLQGFQSQVDTAAKASVERVNMEIENLSKDHAHKLSSFFSDLTAKNDETFAKALDGVKLSTQKLAESVDSYSHGMRTNVASIEAKVVAFSESVSKRLHETTFPDDYFAQHLQGPLAQLKETSSALAGGIKESFHEVSQSTTVLAAALKKLNSKASATELSLQTVIRLSQQQQTVLQTAQGQLTTLEQLSSTIAKLDTAMIATVGAIAEGSSANKELSSRLSELIADGAQARQGLEHGLADLSAQLSAQSQAIGSVASSLGANTDATQAVATALAAKLDASGEVAVQAASAAAAAAQVSDAIAKRIEVISNTDETTARAISAIGQQVASAAGGLREGVERLQSMERLLKDIDGALRNQTVHRVDASSSSQPHRPEGIGSLASKHYDINEHAVLSTLQGAPSSLAGATSSLAGESMGGSDTGSTLAVLTDSRVSIDSKDSLEGTDSRLEQAGIVSMSPDVRDLRS